MSDERGWTELSAGDRFAGYRIERRLGRGGMGILYLAVEPGLERRVALKLILPEAATDPVFSRRFAEESRIAASIEHPNVVPIYAAGEEGGVPYIAMRYVAGSDLGRRLEHEGRLDPELAAELTAQIGNGLDAIHLAGLIHRDVKPANVLLSGGEGSEHAYITDFGVARNVATESGLTKTGRFVGTLDYVAPEQIAGDRVDARADVYALGCLLFKLLTGEVPFPRDAEAARLYAHLNDPPPPPSQQVPVVPPALDAVVARAMAKRPGDRYPSAGDLGRAAVAALSGAAVALPERTVATGAAATVEAETAAAELEPTVESGVEATADSGDEMAAEGEAAATRAADTRRLGREVAAERSGHGSRRALIAGGLAAFVGAAVVAVVLASGGGGKSGGVAETEVRTTPTQTQPTTAKEATRTEAEKLTKAELIAAGDEICADSQETYVGYRNDPRFENSESEPDASYSQLLVNISTEAVREFNELVPPTKLSKEYRAYVAAQEEVKRWDQEALEAAEEGNATAYLRAREDRDFTAAQRTELAEAVGFELCSGSKR
ncbi:MAG: serine/threonine-protein kinase [Solirubrobacterales bacterium]